MVLMGHLLLPLAAVRECRTWHGALLYPDVQRQTIAWSRAGRLPLAAAGARPLPRPLCRHRHFRPLPTPGPLPAAADARPLPAGSRRAAPRCCWLGAREPRCWAAAAYCRSRRPIAGPGAPCWAGGAPAGPGASGWDSAIDQAIPDRFRNPSGAVTSCRAAPGDLAAAAWGVGLQRHGGRGRPAATRV